jgi:hypothetical protein
MEMRSSQASKLFCNLFMVFQQKFAKAYKPGDMYAVFMSFFPDLSECVNKVSKVSFQERFLTHDLSTHLVFVENDLKLIKLY